jgi:hypothetical protein
MIKKIFFYKFFYNKKSQRNYCFNNLVFYKNIFIFNFFFKKNIFNNQNSLNFAHHASANTVICIAAKKVIQHDSGGIIKFN